MAVYLWDNFKGIRIAKLNHIEPHCKAILDTMLEY